MIIFLLLLAALLAAPAARAGETPAPGPTASATPEPLPPPLLTLWRTDGTTLRGRVTEKTDESVIVETEAGEVLRQRKDEIDWDRTAEFSLRDVETMDEAYARRLAEYEAAPESADASWELGHWLSRRGFWIMEPELGSAEWEGLRLIREALERDSDHAAARAWLGYRRVGDQWLTQGEIAFLEAQRAKGFVEFDGEWMTPAEAALRREGRNDFNNELIGELYHVFGPDPVDGARTPNELIALWQRDYEGRWVAWRGWLESIIPDPDGPGCTVRFRHLYRHRDAVIGKETVVLVAAHLPQGFGGRSIVFRPGDPVSYRARLRRLLTMPPRQPGEDPQREGPNERRVPTIHVEIHPWDLIPENAEPPPRQLQPGVGR